MTGVLLLVTGAASAGLAILGARWALGFLALLGVLAVPVGRTLPDVSASPSRWRSAVTASRRWRLARRG